MIDPNAEWISKRVDGVLSELEGTPEDALDEAVYEAHAEMAAETNNAGMPAQVEFLIRQGWKPADILARAQQATEQDDGDAGSDTED